jgi:SHS2 domain-containing protein
MTYAWVDHTAELELRLESETEEGIYADALAAFAELVASDETGEPVRVPVEVEAADRPGLLVAWLEELVYLADARALEPESVTGLVASENAVSATVAGRLAAPRPLVKAVTYHGADFRDDGSRWHARVVLDV